MITSSQGRRRPSVSAWRAGWRRALSPPASGDLLREGGQAVVRRHRAQRLPHHLRGVIASGDADQHVGPVDGQPFSAEAECHEGDPGGVSNLSFSATSHYAFHMPATTNRRHTVPPPADPDEMLDLSKFLDGLSQPAALLGPDGQTVPLPLEAFNVLREVAESMRAGKAITVAPVDQMLTTQEAANFLGISRPTLIKLLGKNQIPHEFTSGGRHRRIRLQDVVEHQEKKRAQRRQPLEQLTAEASAAGLYERGAEDYRGALGDARGGLEAENR